MNRKKGKAVKRAVARIVGAVLLTVFFVSWTHMAEEDARYTPNYAKVDIEKYLDKAELTEREYWILYWQTGLSPIAVDTLRKEGRAEEMLLLQERFFEKVQVCCERDFLVFNEVLELSDRGTELSKVARRTGGKAVEDKGLDFMPALEDGDVLITFNSHFLGWRNGHVAIVIDAEMGKTLEALTLGTNSSILSVDRWRDCPSFAVLRLSGASEEQRAAIADYAEANLVKLPYRLTAAIFDEAAEKGKISSAGTNCSHLVWKAYEQFGYNLDSDGGVIVTPKDLFESPFLEVVQVYGMNPL
uniref:hypothetical protein n=1 Tax=Acetatifactor sp. TaxID=1872090 RepID=UPI00405695C2